MRGRKPVPTPLKLVRGNPGRRPLAPEPTMRAALPSCPPSVIGEARKEWRRLCRELKASGLLRPVDRGALAVCCQLWAQLVRLEEEIDSGGEGGPAAFVVTAQSGYPMPNPIYGMVNTARLSYLKAAAELGITPTARSRVSAGSTGGTQSKVDAFRAQKMKTS